MKVSNNAVTISNLINIAKLKKMTTKSDHWTSNTSVFVEGIQRDAFDRQKWENKINRLFSEWIENMYDGKPVDLSFLPI